MQPDSLSVDELVILLRTGCKQVVELNNNPGGLISATSSRRGRSMHTLPPLSPSSFTLLCSSHPFPFPLHCLLRPIHMYCMSHSTCKCHLSPLVQVQWMVDILPDTIPKVKTL